MGIKKVDKIWLDGEFVGWDDATEHVLAHSLHYGVSAFEGVRAYKGADGKPVVFRLREHIDRLLDSCHIATLDCPYSRDQLVEVCRELLRVNRMEEAYLRPLVYLGYGALGLGTREAPVRTMIAAYEWGAYLGAEGLKSGIRCKVSGLRRGNIDSFLSKGKISGQYVTSVLAKRDAIANGFDEAIMLDTNGMVCEGTGENLFIIKDDVLRTAPTSSSILAGITRDTVITLARELGYELREQAFTVDELWCADEVFLTGTAAEVTPVREIDGRRIGRGEPGPITRRLQDHYLKIVRGGTGAHPEWFTTV